MILESRDTSNIPCQSTDGVVSAIFETGRIVAIEEPQENVWVETVRQSTCGSCSARKSCGSGMLHKLYDGKRTWIKLSTARLTQSLQLDDQVEIMIPGHVLITGSLLVYLLPLCLLILGALSTQSVFFGAFFGTYAGSEGAAILGAIAGLSVGLALVRLHAYVHRDNEDMLPKIVRRLPRWPADAAQASRE